MIPYYLIRWITLVLNCENFWINNVGNSAYLDFSQWTQLDWILDRLLRRPSAALPPATFWHCLCRSWYWPLAYLASSSVYDLLRGANWSVDQFCEPGCKVGPQKDIGDLLDWVKQNYLFLEPGNWLLNYFSYVYDNQYQRFGRYKVMDKCKQGGRDVELLSYLYLKKLTDWLLFIYCRSLFLISTTKLLMYTLTK